jgi:hypothetical protein
MNVEGLLLDGLNHVRRAIMLVEGATRLEVDDRKAPDIRGFGDERGEEFPHPGPVLLVAVTLACSESELEQDIDGLDGAAGMLLEQERDRPDRRVSLCDGPMMRLQRDPAEEGQEDEGDDRRAEPNGDERRARL